MTVKTMTGVSAAHRWQHFATFIRTKIQSQYGCYHRQQNRDVQ